ncbi:MAG: DNA recombination protein RmuC [Actinobacteria bacterium]|nr:DNA recombination protein RmuC [Actinomycetota bacterium]
MTELLPLLGGLVLGLVLGAAVTLAVVRSRDDAATSRTAALEAARAATLQSERAAVAAMVEPVNRSLAQVAQSLAEAERARIESHAELRHQLAAAARGTETLGRETGRLASALRRSDVRGRWGELALRKLVESAGLLPHVHFVEQHSTRDDDGTLLRADMVVDLADGRSVVVDSKVPMSAYLDAVDCDDEDERERLLSRHAADLAKHVDALSSKQYWRRYDSPELVVLFLPSEQLLTTALDHRPDLLERAFERDVVVATPSTLLALLRTVAHTWRQEAAARNARELHAQARELVGRLATMGGHVDRLGAALSTAVRAYNEAVGSLETRVLVSARRIAAAEVDDAVATADGALPQPRLVADQPRAVTAPELLAWAEDHVGQLGADDDVADPAVPALGTGDARTTHGHGGVGAAG